MSRQWPIEHSRTIRRSGRLRRALGFDRYQEALPLLKRGLASAADIYFTRQYQDVLDYVEQQVEGEG